MDTPASTAKAAGAHSLPEMEPDYPSAVRAWYTVGVLIIASILGFLDRQVLGLLVEPIRHDLGITDSQISLLQGLSFSLCYAGAMLPLGVMIDRSSRRNIIIGGVLVWSVMTIACGVVNSFGGLFIARMGVGLGEACLVPASYSLTADLFTAARRGRGIGVMGTGMSFGAAGSLVVAGIVLSLTHSMQSINMPFLGDVAIWRFIFIVVGLPGVPIAILLLTTREPARHGKSVPQGEKRTFGEMLAYVATHKRTIGAVIFVGVLNSSVGMAASSWIPTALIRRFGMSPAEVGIAVGTASIIGGGLGPLVGGFLTDWYVARGALGGRLALHLFSGPIAIVGLLIFAFGASPFVCIAGGATCIFGTASLAAAGYTMVPDLAPNEYHGQLIALSVISNQFGNAISPTMVALYTERLFQRPDSVHLSIALTAIPIILVATTTAAFSLRAYSQTITDRQRARAA